MKKGYVLLLSMAMVLLISGYSIATSSGERKKANANPYRGGQKVKLELTELKGQVKHPEIRDGIFEMKSGDGQVSFMNVDGALIGDLKYDTFAGFSEGLAFVTDGNGERYYIDTAGKKVIEAVDGKKIYMGDVFQNGIAKVSFAPVDLSKDENENFQYIDKNGKRVDYQKPMYKNYEIFYIGPYGSFYTDTQTVGIFDVQNKKPITELKYVDVQPFVKDRTVVKDKENRILVLNGKGVVVENLSKKYEGRKISSYFLSEDGIVVNFEDQKTRFFSTETAKKNFAPTILISARSETERRFARKRESTD